MSEDPPAVGPWAVLVFVCELAMLAGLAVAGFRLAPAGPLAYALMVALPIAVAVIWGLLLAPRSAKGLKGHAATVGKIVVFVLAGVLLALTGQDFDEERLAFGYEDAAGADGDRAEQNRSRPVAVRRDSVPDVLVQVGTALLTSR